VLARGTEVLAKAVAEHSAVPAFATYNLEMVQAVVAAAEQTGRPVIVLAGSSHFNHSGRSALISIALQAAGLHRDDRGPSRPLPRPGRDRAVRAGRLQLVMVDGSHLSFEDNVERVWRWGWRRTSHVPLPLAAAAQQLYLIAEAAGLGAHDDSSVVTILSPKKATDSAE
jgi:fructose/tagatose bisphosphate aldolase